MNVINPLDRKFLCQHRNGANFTVNPTTDFVPYLQGDLPEKLKFIAEVEVYTITEASSTEQITAITAGLQIKLTHPFENWATGGYVVGNAIRVEVGGNFVTGTVDSIVGLDMYITAAAFFATLLTTDGDASPAYVIKVTTVPTGLIFKYGIIPNTANAPSFVSPLTGEDQVYSANGITGVLTDLNYNASVQSNLGAVQAKFDGSSGMGNYIHKFTIEHVFQTPHFIEAWLTNYQNSTIPSDFQGTNTYKYLVEYNFVSNINNPNDGKIFLDDFQQGSLGFLGQNFNTGVSDYSVESIVYDDGLFIIPNIDVDITTNVTIRLKRASGAFANGERVYIYHSKEPTQAEYSNDPNTFVENFVFDSITNTEGAGAIASGIFTNFSLIKDGGDPSIIIVTFSITYAAEQKDNFLDNGDLYFIGAGVEDGPMVTAVTSDRVVVIADSNSYTKSEDITGLITANQIDFLQSGDEGAIATPTSNVDGWNNNIYKLNGEFWLSKFSNAIVSLKTFELQLVARKGTSSEFFVISSYVFPIPVNPPGVQQIGGSSYQMFNVDIQRELGSLPLNDTLRRVLFLANVVPVIDNDPQLFKWELGYEISWRELEENIGIQPVAPEFYDALEPFDNFNDRTSNYSGENGYEIYFFAITDVDLLGVKGLASTRYAMASDLCIIRELDEVATPGYVGATEILDEDDNPTDLIDLSKYHTAKVTIDLPGAIPSESVYAFEIVLENSAQTGQDYRLHSNKDWSNPDNALEPLPGQAFVKVTEVPGVPNKLIGECRIKKDFLDDPSINVYGHLTARDT